MAVAMPYSSPSWLWAIVLSLGLCLWGQIDTALARSPERLELLGLLQERQFDELEGRLAGYLQGYRAGEISDHVLERAYNAFASADPALERLLDEWIAARPESYSARMGRANYFQHLGLVYRGHRRRTPKDRGPLMSESFARAKSDLAAALEINPHLGVAYGSLIVIGMVLGKHAEVDALVRTGLEADPRSFTIRRRYLYSLVPRWRAGTEKPFEAIRNFVAEVERDAVDNPALLPLKGFVDFAVAGALAWRGRREEAVAHFEKALRFGDYWWYLDRQGYNYYWLQRYDDAVASFTRALKAWPQVPGTLDWRARSWRKLGQLDRGFADWDSALSLDPANPRILVQVAYGLRDLQRYDAVLSTLDRAMLYGADDENVRDARGRILLYELERPAESIADLRRATELNPRKKKYWYNYGLALYRIKDCEAVPALTTYLKVCEAGAKCKADNPEWASEVIAGQAICDSR